MLLRLLLLAFLTAPAIVARAQSQPASLRPGHVHIWVADVERTKAFYRDQIGLTVTSESPGQNVQFDGGKLWFGKFKGTGKPQTNGITIGIEAASVEAAYQTLKQRGLDLPHPPEQRPHGWSFHFSDPDGYAIEVEGNK